jgi:hypothetical protein
MMITKWMNASEVLQLCVLLAVPGAGLAASRICLTSASRWKYLEYKSRDQLALPNKIQWFSCFAASSQKGL